MGCYRMFLARVGMMISQHVLFHLDQLLIIYNRNLKKGAYHRLERGFHELSFHKIECNDRGE